MTTQKTYFWVAIPLNGAEHCSRTMAQSIQFDSSVLALFARNLKYLSVVLVYPYCSEFATPYATCV
jgi:hypothetical protein